MLVQTVQYTFRIWKSKHCKIQKKTDALSRSSRGISRNIPSTTTKRQREEEWWELTLLLSVNNDFEGSLTLSLPQVWAHFPISNFLISQTDNFPLDNSHYIYSCTLFSDINEEHKTFSQDFQTFSLSILDIFCVNTPSQSLCVYQILIDGGCWWVATGSGELWVVDPETRQREFRGLGNFQTWGFFPFSAPDLLLRSQDHFSLLLSSGLPLPLYI